jgi:SnoaL-like domain
MTTVTESVEAQVEALEKRVQELEDVREINEVMRRWHVACSGGFSGIQSLRSSESLPLLTDDAIVEVKYEAGNSTVVSGHEAIAEYFAAFAGDNGELPYVFQTGVDYGVKVNGNSAVQESNLVILRQSNLGGATFGLSQFTNEYLRTAEGWKISKLSLQIAFSVPVQELTGGNPLD